MSYERAEEFLKAITTEANLGTLAADLRKLQPADRVAYALLALADVLDVRLGEFTFHAPDPAQPGALEAVVMAMRDK